MSPYCGITWKLWAGRSLPAVLNSTCPTSSMAIPHCPGWNGSGDRSIFPRVYRNRSLWFVT